jgi:bifunctional non-homologous end joining protein LigD
MPDLGEYRRRRDPRRTPEPVPEGAPQPVGNDDRFVVHEHHARRLHWDVRLERGGVLVSWAVPKGLPAQPGVVRLAVHTEDHPLEYATFEGEIPRGEYGAGLMRIWDAGHYETKLWTDDKVEITLHGQRVQGRYVFLRRQDNWLVRRIDPAQRPDWQPMPEELAPMLATAGTLPLLAEDEQWGYEFKWDGVRTLLWSTGGRIRLASRTGADVTASYPELRGVGEQLGSTEALLDGEVVALTGGRPSFAALQRRMHVADAAQARRLAAQQPVTYLVFDLLHLDGRSCLDLPYQRRRRLLDELALRGRHWQTPRCYAGGGAEVLAASREQGLEGVVAKRLDAPYQPGRRSRDWIKVTQVTTQEVVVGGWRAGSGRREGVLGALLLGVPDGDGRLRYVGSVGTGFSATDLEVLTRKLAAAGRRTSPFATPVPAARARGAHWVRPELVGEVVFRDWTRDGRLRLPSWRGLRVDKRPEDVAADGG